MSNKNKNKSNDKPVGDVGMPRPVSAQLPSAIELPTELPPATDLPTELNTTLAVAVHGEVIELPVDEDGNCEVLIPSTVRVVGASPGEFAGKHVDILIDQNNGEVRFDNMTKELLGLPDSPEDKSSTDEEPTAVKQGDLPSKADFVHAVDVLTRFSVRNDGLLNVAPYRRVAEFLKGFYS